MARAHRQFDPAIEAMVNERLHPNECVQGWSQLQADEILVRLIDQELHRVCQPIAKKFGRGAGTGRSLQFRRENGTWVFIGEGGWIS